LKVSVLETGGTIGSVEKVLKRGKIPDVQVNVVRITPRTGSNMRPADWVVIGKSVMELCEAGCDGIVVTHGTDTLAYTAAALSFMVQALPIPVIVTGSIINGKFRNSDAYNNLRNSIIAATSELAEICVVFSDSENGNDASIIRGTRSREIRPTKLNAFASINVPPIGVVRGDRAMLNEGSQFRKRSGCKPIFYGSFNPAVSLIRFYPSISIAYVEGLLKASAGTVIEGYGSGQVLPDSYILKALSRFPGPMALTTPGIVYDYQEVQLHSETKPTESAFAKFQAPVSRLISLIRPQRSVLSIRNIIPVHDMLAEVALVKMMWTLGNGLEPRESFKKSYCGEINS